MAKSGKKRAPSAFNLFMKTEIGRVKKANSALSHMQAFKQAAHNWKKGPSNKVAAKKTRKYSHPKKGQPSRTRPGKLDFVTHKGNKDFNKGNKRQRKSRKPYQKK
jgi:hypothetical protein